MGEKKPYPSQNALPSCLTAHSQSVSESSTRSRVTCAASSFEVKGNQRPAGILCNWVDTWPDKVKKICSHKKRTLSKQNSWTDISVRTELKYCKLKQLWHLKAHNYRDNSLLLLEHAISPLMTNAHHSGLLKKLQGQGDFGWFFFRFHVAHKPLQNVSKWQ